VEHFLEISDELTVDDIMILAQKVLSSPLTMACSGDGTSFLHFPAYLCSLYN